MANINNELYHYGAELNEVETLLEENGGELTEEANDKLVALENRGVVIANDMYNFLAEKDATIELCKAEIKRIQDIKRRAESTKETIKGAMLNLMLNKGIEAFKSDLHSMKVSAGRESVDVLDDNIIIDKFNGKINALRAELPDYISIEVKVSKTALATALKAGELIQGAEIIRKPSLLIK